MRHPLIAATKVIAFVLIVSASLFADAIVDNEFDDNQNDFEYYWYYYYDNAGVGKDDRLQSTAPGTPSVIYVASREYTQADGKTIKDYRFTVGNENGTNNWFATLPFEFGSTWKTSADTLAQPFVGVGTMLCANGTSKNLTGATAVKFKIRSHTGPLNVRFNVQTFEIDSLSNVHPDSLNGNEFGYHGKSVTATPLWSKIVVNIADLALPNLSVRNIPFNLKKCTKLAWEIQKETNQTTTIDTIDIDDITIIGGFTNLKLRELPQSGQFATFDVRPYNESPLATYWYAFDDRQIGGTSKVNKGAMAVELSNRLKIDLIEKSGSDSIGRGLQLTYQLGKSFKQDSAEIKGFIGMGCPLYDSIVSVYWNAKNEAIYFHYITYDDSTKVTFEINDINDVPDELNPTRKDLRGPGVFWHKVLSATGGEWRAVVIPFDSLVCDKNSDGSPNIPLDRTKLSKIQWKVKGSEGQTGTVAIDNVYFPGPGCFCIPDAVKHTLHSGQHLFFNTQYLNGFVHVKFNNKTSLTSGKISLFKAQGSVISTTSLTKTNTVSANLPAKNLPSGVYFVKINGVDVNGKAVILQAPVSIVR